MKSVNSHPTNESVPKRTTKLAVPIKWLVDIGLVKLELIAEQACLVLGSPFTSDKVVVCGVVFESRLPRL